MLKIVKIGAPWCCQCKVQTKELEKALKVIGDVKFEELEATDEVAEKYNVRNLPVTLFVREDDGEVVGRLNGLTMSDNIIQFYKDLTK